MYVVRNWVNFKEMEIEIFRAKHKFEIRGIFEILFTNSHKISHVMSCVVQNRMNFKKINFFMAKMKLGIEGISQKF